MFKRSMVLALAFVMVLSTGWAFDGYAPDHKNFKTQTQVFNVVHQFWTVNELFYQISVNHTPDLEEQYLKASEIYEKQSLEMGKLLLSTLEDRNREVVEVVSEIYKSFDPISRMALYPAIGYLRVAIVQDPRAPLTQQEFKEYFPGYGYGEPGYKYRKGREIDREPKGCTWQQEETSITTTWNVELVVTLDILNILAGWATGGIIKDLQVGPQETVNVNGTPMIVCKVSFTRVKAITTKTNRKFEVNKIWFELMRAKVSGWSTGPWELCGKTYEILHEPTGEEVVIGISAQ